MPSGEKWDGGTEGGVCPRLAAWLRETRVWEGKTLPQLRRPRGQPAAAFFLNAVREVRPDRRDSALFGLRAIWDRGLPSHSG